MNERIYTCHRHSLHESALKRTHIPKSFRHTIVCTRKVPTWTLKQEHIWGEHMSREKGMLGFLWVLTTALLLIFIPKNKVRHGVLAFLYKQVITWLFGLLVVEKGLIKYPVRIFKKANKTSFSFEYYFYPALCAIFNIHYPENRKKLIKVLYYIFHAGVLTTIEVLLERNTKLIKYIKWKWYWSFITVGLSYYNSRLFYRWFFKEEFPQKNEMG